VDDATGDERQVRRCRVRSAECSWSKVRAEDGWGWGGKEATTTQRTEFRPRPVSSMTAGTQEHTAFAGIAGTGVVFNRRNMRPRLGTPTGVSVYRVYRCIDVIIFGIDSIFSNASDVNGDGNTDHQVRVKEEASPSPPSL